MLIRRRKLFTAAAGLGALILAPKKSDAGYGLSFLSSTRSEFLNGGAHYYGGLTPASGSGAYGALASLGTNSFDYDFIVLNVLSNGTLTRSRISLTYNNSGVDEPLVSDLIWDTGAFNTSLFDLHVFIPVKVPQGSIIKAKIWANSGTSNVTLALTGFQGDARQQPGFRALLSATDYGATFDPTNIITFTSTTTTGWVVAQAATPVKFAGITACYDSLGVSTTAYIRFDIGYGPSGSEKMITSFELVAQNVSANAGNPIITPPLPCDIPAGSRLVYRATCDRTTTTTAALGLLGLAA